jgi:uncharacterized alpha-E superfamily protein
MARPQWLPVLDLLLRDESNPRSVAFQLLGLHEYLLRLSETYGECGAAALAPLIGAMHRLDSARDLASDSIALRGLMDQMQAEAFALADRINQRFFSHGDESGQQVFAP